MKVLIGCEESGTVRDAFLAEGFDAWSCDLKPAAKPTNRHIVGDVTDVMNWDDWDLLCVMHPPCTRLCNSGVRWLSSPPTTLMKTEYPDDIKVAYETWDHDERLAFMWDELDKGAALFSACWNTKIPRVAVENPVMHKHAKARIVNFKPHSQSVQPWQFGDDPDGPDNEKKRTCFWLRDLPNLKPTGTLDGSTARSSVHMASPGAKRSEIRSTFFPGMAKAMAQQWGYAATLQLAA